MTTRKQELDPVTTRPLAVASRFRYAKSPTEVVPPRVPAPPDLKESGA